MTVKQLINKLKDYPQDSVIVGYNEYGDCVDSLKLDIGRVHETDTGQFYEVSVILDFWYEL